MTPPSSERCGCEVQAEIEDPYRHIRDLHALLAASADDLRVSRSLASVRLDMVENLTVRAETAEASLKVAVRLLRDNYYPEELGKDQEVEAFLLRQKGSP